MARNPNGHVTGTGANDVLWGTAVVLSDGRYDNYADSDSALRHGALRGFGGNDLILGDIYYNGTDYAESDEAYGGDGNDTIYGDCGPEEPGWQISNNGASDVLYGDAGHDQIFGQAGGDRIYGGHGNDTLQGDDGHDLLSGGLGADSYYCGAGNDTYVIDNRGDRLIGDHLDYGADRVISSLNWTLGAYQEHLTLTGTAIAGNGNAGGNALLGNGAANLLNGLAGNDTLNGGAGNDSLAGGMGADQLIGGMGADHFVFGQAGASTFGPAGRDVITDFSLSQGDRIDLRGMDANAGVAGDQAFHFIGAAGFSGQAGQLHYQNVAGGVLISGDLNGDRIADFGILLDDPLTPNANFFLL